MKTNKKLLTATIGLGMLLAAPLAMADDHGKKGHGAHDRNHAAQMDSNEPVTDTWITTKVKSDLLVSDATPGTDIKVETVNGVVSLSGSVATKAEHDDAVAKTRMIKGVKNVDASALRVAGTAGR